MKRWMKALFLFILAISTLSACSSEDATFDVKKDIFVVSSGTRGAIILSLDITERSMSEKLRREFSAKVSHELKTPLTIIYGNSEMLKNGMVKVEVSTIIKKSSEDYCC